MKVIFVGLALGSAAGIVLFDSTISAQTRPAAIVRTAADGAIAGHVTDARSKPIDTYSVIVFPTDRATWVPDARSVTLAHPAPDGGFEVIGLPAGEYWVAAVDASQSHQSVRDFAKPDVLEALSTRATRVTLAEHERYVTVLRVIRR